MKKILLIAISLLFLSVILVSAAEKETGWRCGNLFIEKGVDSFQVLKNCGEPISKEVVGNTESGELGEPGLIIEKWVYGPEAGYYYILYIKGGVVDKVESERVEQ